MGPCPGERWRPRTLLDTLVEAASKGGNLLLNGAHPEGELRPRSWRGPRRWGRLAVHGEAIYGARRAMLRVHHPWLPDW